MALSPSTRAWIHGLGAAFIGAVAATLTTTLSAPGQFNFTTLQGLQHIALSAFVAGVGSSAAYLMKSPLPSAMTATETQSVETPDGTTKTATSTVKVE